MIPTTQPITPYISFSNIGMPMKNQINATRGVSVVFNYLNRVYDKSLTQNNTWFNTDISEKVEITGCTGFSDILISNVVNNRWKIIEKISTQDYYNIIKDL